MIGTMVSAKVLLSAVATAVVGVGATAYAGALPTSAQRVAHDLVGAPAARSSHHPNPHSKGHAKSHAKPAGKPGSHAGKAVGPDAKGPAAYGLCNAYAHAHVHGNSMGHSIAMRNLGRAAGGADKITAYCATIPHPSPSPTH